MDSEKVKSAIKDLEIAWDKIFSVYQQEVANGDQKDLVKPCLTAISRARLDLELVIEKLTPKAV